MLKKSQLMALLGLCVALPLQAATPPAPTPAPVPFLAALKAGQFAELDKTLNGAQHAYELGQINDVQLYGDFRAFDGKDATLEPELQAWAQHYPRSYAAHLALALYYERAGREARGHQWIEKTSPEKLGNMEELLQKADAELQRSFKLTTKPILSYTARIEIDQYTGDSADALRALKTANRIAVENFVARRQYMLALQHRWGGSFGQQFAFLAECKAAGLDRAQLDVLESLIHADMANDLADAKNDLEASVQYDKFAALSKPHLELLNMDVQYLIAWRMAQAYAKVHNDGKALHYADLGLHDNPSNMGLLRVKVNALLHLQRHDEAVANLKTMAALGDGWARDKLATM